MTTSKAERLSRLPGSRGANYLPSWGQTQAEFWSASLRPDRLRLELGMARHLGLDHVRVYSSTAGYELDPDAYIAGIATLLRECEAQSLGVILALFDSCGVEPAVGTEPLTLEEVYGRCDGDARLQHIRTFEAAQGRDLLEASRLVTVPWAGDPAISIWNQWTASPSYALLGEEHWPRWDGYTQRIVDVAAASPAALLLEVMNEPYVTQVGSTVDLTPIDRFYTHVGEVIRDRSPLVPVSVGADRIENFLVHEARSGTRYDAISIHSYDTRPRMEEQLNQARGVAGGRPIQVTEYGYWMGGDDALQREVYAAALDVLDAYPEVGATAFHLIAGWGPFGNTALLYPSGMMRPAAQELRHRLAAR